MAISSVHMLVIAGEVLATSATGIAIPDDSFAARMERSMQQMHLGMHVEQTGDLDREAGDSSPAATTVWPRPPTACSRRTTSCSSGSLRTQRAGRS